MKFYLELYQKENRVTVYYTAFLQHKELEKIDIV